jgi:hypothetical protein
MGCSTFETGKYKISTKNVVKDDSSETHETVSLFFAQIITALRQQTSFIVSGVFPEGLLPSSRM